MRFKLIVLALNLGLLADASNAQVLPPAKPGVAMPPAAATSVAAPTAGVANAASSTSASTSNLPTQPAPLGPGVVSLSDVAKQSTAAPAPAAATSPALTQQAMVPAITAVDGTGQPIELAREKMRAAASASPKITVSPIQLMRVTRIGGEDTAVLWVKGTHRTVTTGSRVLQYVVGEIKDEGVCLYSAKGKVKDKCHTLLTYQGM